MLYVIHIYIYVAICYDGYVMATYCNSARFHRMTNSFRWDTLQESRNVGGTSSPLWAFFNGNIIHHGWHLPLPWLIASRSLDSRPWMMTDIDSAGVETRPWMMIF